MSKEQPPAYMPQPNEAGAHPMQPIHNQPGYNQPGPNQPVHQQPIKSHGMDPSGQQVTPLQHLSPVPEWIDCQFCKQRTKTDVVKKGTGLQIVTGTVLCLLCICLAPLPCMLHWFEETQWWCTNCKNMVAMRGHDTPTMVQAPPEERVAPSQYASQPPV